MNILQRFRRQSPADPAGQLYQALVAQSRRPEFYTACGVPDSLDGRFDLLVLHVVLVLRRLKSEGASGRALGQALFDIMVTDFDRALRELGVGDVGVAKRMKAMISAFYGRLAAYDAALAEEKKNSAAPGHSETEKGRALWAALRRNLYGTIAADAEAFGLDAMSDYIRRETEGLARQDGAALITGIIQFGPPPGTDRVNSI
jgi:cytochrome b pre-mRNA-processing protein 3